MMSSSKKLGPGQSSSSSSSKACSSLSAVSSSQPQPSTSRQFSCDMADAAGPSSATSSSSSLVTTNLNLLMETDDPKPGPSTSAAEFDLEVFDSGSSCSLEDCWTKDNLNTEPQVKKSSRRSGKRASNRKAVTSSAVAITPNTSRGLRSRSSSYLDEDELEEEEEELVSNSSTMNNSKEVVSRSRKLVTRRSTANVVKSTRADPTPDDRDVDGDDDEDEADLTGTTNVHCSLVEEPPISACPSETEEANLDDEELEEGIQKCQGSDPGEVEPCLCTDGRPKKPVTLSSTSVLPKLTCDYHWSCSSESIGNAPDDKANSVSQLSSPNNIDEIVNDHDNFGTDETEDSLDSITADFPTEECGKDDVGDLQTIGPHEERQLRLLVNHDLEIPLTPAMVLKRKAGSISGNDELDPCCVKKRCMIPQESLAIEAEQPIIGDRDVAKRCNVESVDVVTDISESLEVNADTLISNGNVTALSAASTSTGCNFVAGSPEWPDRAYPSQEMLEWLSRFDKWSSAEKMLAIDQLIGHCQPTQVRHMMAVIEPQFQRDFISLLPKELALYVLSFLSPRDLLRAAQTCRYWRILCEDNLLWREKCRESQILDFKEVMRERLRQPSSSGFVYSVWKSTFMRQHNIEMNWRMRPTRHVKVLKGHDDHVITCLQFSNNRIVSGSDDNTLKVWSAVSGKCLRTLVGHTGGVWSSQMEGNTIVSGSTDRTLKVWDAESGQCVHTLYGHTSTVRCMHLHKTRVVSGSRDATLRMWDINTGECLHVLVGHVAAVRCVQYDGRLVVSGAYDYMVKVWNPEREECLHTLSGHTNRVYSLQFDGVHVVSGSLDTSIRVWDVETGSCKHALMGHQSLTSGMELRNNILVSGNADSTVKVWDITTGQCLQTLSGPNKHQSAVTCLQFNAKFVITSSDDGSVKLWDLKTGEFLRDLVALESGGSGGVVWRIRANPTKLVCAVGSRNGTEETKLLVLDFDAVEGK